MPGAPLDDVILLTVFSRVVETKSFTAAAAALGVTKATVSQRVAALERRCAARLFQRTTRRLSITQEGLQLYEACRGLTAAADASALLLGRVGRTVHGILRVTAPVGFGVSDLVPALPAFSQRYPEVTVDLVLTDKTVDLHAERIDLAVRVARRLPSSDYGARKLRAETMVVCGAPSYLAAHGTPREPGDLRAHLCLRLSSSPREWSFGTGEDLATVPVTGPLCCDNVFALREAAALGCGLAVLPRSLVAAHLRDGRLQVVLGAFSGPRHHVWLLLPDTRNVPAKTRALVAHLTATLGGG
jgi:DNA-binding transcriptional LysR family regulator